MPIGRAAAEGLAQAVAEGEGRFAVAQFPVFRSQLGELALLG